MDNIMNKIAEWLQISVEKAIELYPQLRTEAVWYTVTQSLFYILVTSIVVSLIVTSVCFIPTIEFSSDEDIKRHRKWFKISIYLVVALAFLNIVSPFLYPNIVILKQFIK